MECKMCGEETDELVVVVVKGKKKKACEDCAAKVTEEGEIAERGMMEYKGKF